MKIPIYMIRYVGFFFSLKHITIQYTYIQFLHYYFIHNTLMKMNEWNENDETYYILYMIIYAKHINFHDADH